MKTEKTHFLNSCIKTDPVIEALFQLYKSVKNDKAVNVLIPGLEDFCFDQFGEYFLDKSNPKIRINQKDMGNGYKQLCLEHLIDGWWSQVFTGKPIIFRLPPDYVSDQKTYNEIREFGFDIK